MKKLFLPIHGLPGYLLGLFFLFLLILHPAGVSDAADQESIPHPTDVPRESGKNLGETLTNDGRYFFLSVFNDARDLLQLPFQENKITMRDGLVAATLVGSIPATIYGLDNPIRRNLRKIPDGTADIFQDIGLGMSVGSLGLIYGWGVYSGNEEARRVTLTGIEGIGVTSLVGLGIKVALGRRRPSEGEGPRAFFKGGESFPSGTTTLAFAASTSLSEGFDNRWWAAVPAYGLALMTGVGRIGKDAHWASDILGSALIGIGTTKLLFYLHRQRDGNSALIITPLVTNDGVIGASLTLAM